MGFYIETNTLHDKARVIAKAYDGEIVPQPRSFSEIPEGKGVVCVVDNGLFEAAGFAFDEREFAVFAEPDGRRRTWVLMDYERAADLSGYRNRYPLEGTTE